MQLMPIEIFLGNTWGKTEKVGEKVAEDLYSRKRLVKTDECIKLRGNCDL